MFAYNIFLKVKLVSKSAVRSTLLYTSKELNSLYYVCTHVCHALMYAEQQNRNDKPKKKKAFRLQDWF